MSQNYKRLGLATKLNSISGGTERRLGSRREPEEPLLIRPSSSANHSAGEVRVERDPKTGAILRVLHDSDEEVNPLNDPLRGLDSESEDVREPDMEDVAGATDVVKQLRDQAALPSSRRPRQQSQREKEWISQLVEKHGEDFVRMAMDRKLNPMQQTESNIRKRVEMWRADAQKGDK
jgi:nucleolar protein 16